MKTGAKQRNCRKSQEQKNQKNQKRLEKTIENQNWKVKTIKNELPTLKWPDHTNLHIKISLYWHT